MAAKTSDSDEPVEMRCSSCGYKWSYSGEMYYTTCPRCNRKTQTPLDPEYDE